MINLDGIEVRDGTGEIIIHITKRDAVTGRGKPDDCAAAKACCRLDGVIEARVYRTRTFLLRKSGNKKFWERYRTPDAIRNELIAFDRGGRFEPDDYRMTPCAAQSAAGRASALEKRQVQNQSAAQAKAANATHRQRCPRARPDLGR